jgi:hypothetical protein
MPRADARPVVTDKRQIPFRPDEHIDPTDILDKAHYAFRALAGKDGQCDFEYAPQGISDHRASC